MTLNIGGDILMTLNIDLMEDILPAVGSRTDRAKSITKGVMRIKGDVVGLESVLFDTGALHKSYISEELVDSYRDKWVSSLVPSRSVVKFADQKTTKKAKEELTAEVEVCMSDGNKESAMLSLVVWNMSG